MSLFGDYLSEEGNDMMNEEEYIALILMLHKRKKSKHGGSILESEMIHKG